MITSNQLLPKHGSKPGKDNAPSGGRSMPSRTIVHPKLEMTTPESEEEKEADAVASDIMAGGKLARSISGGGQAGGIAVSSQMESQLGQLQGQGQPMPEALRGMMERGFGRDFSQVRLHTDGTAAEMSSSISAKAFTHGNDIYFGRGQYSPSTTEGQQLVAHELTHVAQGNGKVAREEDLSELTPEERQKRISSIASTQVNEISYSSSLFSPYVPENQSLVGQLMTPMTQVNGNVASGDLSHLTPEERQKRIKRREIKRIAKDFETRAKDIAKDLREIKCEGVIESVIERIVSPMDTSFHRGFLISEIDGIRRRLIVIQEKSEDGNANLTSLEADLEKEIKEIGKIRSAIGIHENNNRENAADWVTFLGWVETASDIAVTVGLPELAPLVKAGKAKQVIGFLAKLEKGEFELKKIKILERLIGLERLERLERAKRAKGAIGAIGYSALMGTALGAKNNFISEVFNGVFGYSDFSFWKFAKKTGRDGSISAILEIVFQLLLGAKGKLIGRFKGAEGAEVNRGGLGTIIYSFFKKTIPNAVKKGEKSTVSAGLDNASSGLANILERDSQLLPGPIGKLISRFKGTKGAEEAEVNRGGLGTIIYSFLKNAVKKGGKSTVSAGLDNASSGLANVDNENESVVNSIIDFILIDCDPENYEEMEYSEEYMKEMLEWKKNH